ncbi:MAG: hypothetical protein WD066_19840 [Planctomycetaceae bacterium]
MAEEAAAAYEQGIKLLDLSDEELRQGWRELMQKHDQNVLVENIGGEVGPILGILRVIETRRALFRAGILVSRGGQDELKGLEDFAWSSRASAVEGGFELTSKRDLGGDSVKLVFGE